MPRRDNIRLLAAGALLAFIAIGSPAGARSQDMPATRATDQQGRSAAAATPAGAGSDESGREPQDMGSPFVPLDSWVYPALDTFSARGYLNSAILGTKPWTRMECARLVDEVWDNLRDDPDSGDDLEGLLGRLQKEFAFETARLGGGSNRSANLESVYTRMVSISGPALTDSYHFGQTISYDFGRPFQRGTNGQAGASVHATAGRFAFFARAEYQHAAPGPVYSTNAIAQMAKRDNVSTSLVPLPSTTAINRARLLDAYATFAFKNWQLVGGRQSLSWSATPDGSMLWSNNSEPITMLRIVNSEPYELGGLLRAIGGVRIDNFVGRLDGHWYISHPYILGQKLSVKPLPFLEVGFGRTLVLGGKGGDPVTARNVASSFTGIPATNRSVPGDNHSEIDWWLRVPGLRNYIVLYGDAYADDDGLPLQNPKKNPWRPGIYLTRFPGIPRLDLHFEGVSTEQKGFSQNSIRDLNYWNQMYRDGYTNNGFLIGNTVGRYGRVMRGWMTYRLTPTHTLRFEYKHNKVSPEFIPGGGYWQDYALSNDLQLHSGWYLKSSAQVENISSFPVLFNGRQRNFTAIVEIGFRPGKIGGN